MSPTDPRWPGRERKFADLSFEMIPNTESMEDCFERVKPLWEERIQKELNVGHTVLVIGHKTSLLGVIKHLQGKSTILSSITIRIWPKLRLSFRRLEHRRCDKIQASARKSFGL